MYIELTEIKTKIKFYFLFFTRFFLKIVDRNCRKVNQTEFRLLTVSIAFTIVIKKDS